MCKCGIVEGETKRERRKWNQEGGRGAVKFSMSLYCLRATLEMQSFQTAQTHRMVPHIQSVTHPKKRTIVTSSPPINVCIFTSPPSHAATARLQAKIPLATQEPAF